MTPTFLFYTLSWGHGCVHSTSPQQVTAAPVPDLQYIRSHHWLGFTNDLYIHKNVLNIQNGYVDRFWDKWPQPTSVYPTSSADSGSCCAHAKRPTTTAQRWTNDHWFAIIGQWNTTQRNNNSPAKRCVQWLIIQPPWSSLRPTLLKFTMVVEYSQKILHWIIILLLTASSSH